MVANPAAGKFLLRSNSLFPQNILCRIFGACRVGHPVTDTALISIHVNAAGTVKKWLNNMKKNHMSESSGLIASIVMPDYDGPSCTAVKGSYTALSCYYLTFIDEDFARDQYEKFKALFLKKRPITGFKEYNYKSPIFAFDIDAGFILMGLSPAGAAESLPSACPPLAEGWFLSSQPSALIIGHNTQNAFPLRKVGTPKTNLPQNAL